MEETVELPNGYLLMDTVCLLNYIQGKSSNNFDYKQVEKYVRDKGWWMVITPNTLYECIQCCTDIEHDRGQVPVRFGTGAWPQYKVFQRKGQSLCKHLKWLKVV